MSGEWYDDRRNLAAVARYMEEQGDTSADVVYMLEKPWKFEEDWRLSPKPEGVGTGAGEGATGQDAGTVFDARKVADKVRERLEAVGEWTDDDGAQLRMRDGRVERVIPPAADQGGSDA